VTLSTATYADGVLDGLIRLWSEEGVLIEETTYSEGQKTGPSLSWYADGTPQSEGRLENGRRIGRWTYWKSDGALNERWSGVFDDDERVSPLESEGGAPRPPHEGPR
jgi:antitoxin component YwqK of YwqJK toxin-antitoxin module